MSPMSNAPVLTAALTSSDTKKRLMRSLSGDGQQRFEEFFLTLLTEPLGELGD